MATFLRRAFALEPAASGGFVDTAVSVHAAAIESLAAANITTRAPPNPPDTAPMTR